MQKKKERNFISDAIRKSNSISDEP